MAKLYSKVVGVALLAVGLLGVILNEQSLFGLLHFEMVHNVVHLLTGAIGAWVGFKGSDKAAKMFAQVFGVVYTLLAIAGFAGVMSIGEMLGTMHLMDPAYNVIHLIVGAWGLYAGFKPGAPATPVA